MLVVWGTQVSNKVIATGQFYCPACRQHRSYTLRRPKKWGSIYWIPIIPLEDFEPYVECDSCQRTFPEHVLQQDPASAQREHDAQRERDDNLSRMLCQVMSLMAEESNGVSARLSDLIAGAVRRILMFEMTPEAIRAAIAAGPNDPETVLSNVERQAAALTDIGKERVLRAAVSAAPKPLNASRRTLAAEVGRRLGMAPARMNGVLAELSAN
jgi:hypothetical protein